MNVIESARYPVGDPHYRNLGYLTNPFRPTEREGQFTPGALSAHAAAARLLSRMDAEAAKERCNVLWAERSPEMTSTYYRSAVAETVKSVSDGHNMELLTAYVPLIMMRQGRIRGTLSSLAERIAVESFGLTLGRYVAGLLGEPDMEIAERAAVTTDELASWARRFEDEPEEAAAEVFGEAVAEREGFPGVDVLMYDTTQRRQMYEVDPDEAAEAEEDDALATPPDELTIEDTEEHAVDPEIERVRWYVIYHVKDHHSAVLARALKAYVASGLDALSQELKITKAPRKTIRAIAEFATVRYRKCVAMYDQLHNWPAVPDDQRIQIASGLTEVRLTLGDIGMMVFIAPEGQALEIREQFAGTEIVSWGVPSAEALRDDDVSQLESIAAELVDAARLAPEIMAGEVATVDVPDGAESLVGALVEMGAAFDDLAS